MSLNFSQDYIPIVVCVVQNFYIVLASALYQPNGIFLVAGLPDTHIENSDMRKEAKSVSKCAASVAIAKLLDITPPVQEERQTL